MDAVVVLELPWQIPTSGLPSGSSRRGLAVSPRHPFELPPEAIKLIGQVHGLEEQARRVRDEMQRDLAGIRKAAADERAEVAREVARLRRESAAQTAAVRQEARADLRSVEQARAALTRDREALEALLTSQVRGFEFIASAWADYDAARAAAQAAELESKAHPAVSAAAEVRAKGRELSQLRRELKRVQWVLRLYEFHFPWLTELREMEEEASFVQGEAEPPGPTVDAPGEPDPAQHWLSADEYAALSEAERNRRALDRYLRSHKTPWQLGRDYERYIGYLRERTGARVIYQGIFAGLEDLGRDLICETDEAIEVVQCKRWSQQKTIHEKHVFQLFGTVVAMRIERPEKTVSGTFTTTTTLSQRAREFAEQLGIRVEETVPLSDYPRIKCNVGSRGERIYHLPFDQQYDATLIEPDRGERWSGTVAEAESLGFRRAWRWRSASAPTAS